MKIKDTKLNWTLNVVARVFVGAVFLFSSFVKGVDPMGTAFKITEYMTAWSIGNITFEWATPLAPFLSMALITAEFTVGVMLITGSFRRLSAWLLALMMLFFTVTTLIDAITNKVTDCGCFGDFWTLTNWETFAKNIVLDVPTVWILLTCGLRTKKHFERDMIITCTAVILMVAFGLYNINHEPCLDFRAWKVGNQMVDMDPTLEVKSYVTYKNKVTGETEEMLSSELVQKMEDPDWEEIWEWESSRVVDPHEIKADGFSMLDDMMNDHATELIASEEPLMIVTIHHIDKVNAKGVEAIKQMVQQAEEQSIPYVLLTSALPERVEQFLYDNGLEGMEFYFADATAIETMLRSNPGFILLKEGKVLGKWHYKQKNKQL